MASDTKKHVLTPNAWVDISGGAETVSGICLVGTLLLHYGVTIPGTGTPDVIPYRSGESFSLDMAADATLWAKSGDSLGCDVRVIRKEA